MISGSADARSGTSVAPALPPIFLNDRSPSFVIERICPSIESLNENAGSNVAGASSSEETVRVPPRCSVAEAPTASHRSSPLVASDPSVPPTGTGCSTSWSGRSR